MRDRNPIGILDHMASNDDVVLCPLVYGYVELRRAGDGHQVAFHDAPRRIPGRAAGFDARRYGIGISRRCEITPALKEHLLWLMSPRGPRSISSPHMTASRLGARPG